MKNTKHHFGLIKMCIYCDANVEGKENEDCERKKELIKSGELKSVENTPTN